MVVQLEDASWTLGNDDIRPAFHDGPCPGRAKFVSDGGVFKAGDAASAAARPLIFQLSDGDPGLSSQQGAERPSCCRSQPEMAWIMDGNAQGAGHTDKPSAKERDAAFPGTTGVARTMLQEKDRSVGNTT